MSNNRLSVSLGCSINSLASSLFATCVENVPRKLLRLINDYYFFYVYLKCCLKTNSISATNELIYQVFGFLNLFLLPDYIYFF